MVLEYIVKYAFEKLALSHKIVLMKKLIIKKKSFILLEVLIALSLMTLFAIPLTRNPIYFYKKEMTTLEDLSLLKLKKEALFDIKQMLFKNDIPWKDLSINKMGKAPVRSLPHKTLIIKGFKKKEVILYYRIWTMKEKICEKELICRKLGIQISFDADFKNEKKENAFILFAQKMKNPADQPKDPS